MPFCFGNKLENIDIWIYPSDQLGLQPLSIEASLRGLQLERSTRLPAQRSFEVLQSRSCEDERAAADIDDGDGQAQSRRDSRDYC